MGTSSQEITYFYGNRTFLESIPSFTQHTICYEVVSCHLFMLSTFYMTKEDLKSVIQKAINDKNMQQSMKIMHDLFTDHKFGIK